MSDERTSDEGLKNPSQKVIEAPDRCMNLRKSEYLISYQVKANDTYLLEVIIGTNESPSCHVA